MALAVTTVWEINASGDTANSGGFNSAAAGTDYSQGTSPQVTINGAGVTCTVNATTTKLDIAGYTTANTDIGNIVYITGGTMTAGYYEITGQTGGTQWTVDRAAGTAGQTGTGRMGGCKAAPGNLIATGSPVIAGNVIYCKGAMSSISTGLTIPAVGQVQVIGYTTTRNDGVRPTWTLSAGVTLFTINSASSTGWVFDTFIFDGNSVASSRGVNQTAGNVHWVDCQFKGFANNAYTGTVTAFFTNCDFTGNITSIVFPTSGTCIFVGCRFSGNTSVHVVQAQSSSRVIMHGCLFYDNTGASSDCVQVNGSSGLTHLFNCTIDGAGRYGFSAQSTTGLNFLTNCLITNSGSYGVHASAAVESVFLTNCAHYNNSSGFSTGILAAHITGTIALTGDPYVDRSSDDYRIDATASEGGACRAAGYPTTLNTFATSRNVGAFDVAAGGGSSGIIVHPGMSGGARG